MTGKDGAESGSHRPRLAWARLNAYGIILAGLLILAVHDLIHPAEADLTRLVGDIPPGQTIWTAGFTAAGVLLMLGFATTDRRPETAGLLLMCACITAQGFVAYYYLGLTDFTLVRVALIVLLTTCSAARISVLWTRGGMTITIPPRHEADA